MNNKLRYLNANFKRETPYSSFTSPECREYFTEEEAESILQLSDTYSKEQRDLALSMVREILPRNEIENLSDIELVKFVFYRLMKSKEQIIFGKLFVCCCNWEPNNIEHSILKGNQEIGILRKLIKQSIEKYQMTERELYEETFLPSNEELHELRDAMLNFVALHIEIGYYFCLQEQKLLLANRKDEKYYNNIKKSIYGSQFANAIPLNYLLHQEEFQCKFGYTYYYYKLLENINCQKGE